MDSAFEFLLLTVANEMSSNFSLKWNSHYTALREFFSSLHEKHRFSDATIACNGKLYPVHQFVLLASSDYFNAIFEGVGGDGSSLQRHPVLILRDISNATLEDLLCYMYLGEVTVEQGRVAELLVAAKALLLKGLSVIDNDYIPVNNHIIAAKCSTSDSTDDAPALAEIDSEANQDLYFAHINSECNQKQFPIPEVIEHCHPLLTQKQCNQEKWSSKRPCVVRNRKWEQVDQQVHRLNDGHDCCDQGIGPHADKMHCFNQPATDATVSRNPIAQGFCSSLSDPAFTVKLEMFGYGVVAQTLDEPAGAADLSAPMDSTRNSSQSPLDSNLCAIPLSHESTNVNFCSGDHSGKLATCSSSVNCIPLVQLQTEATRLASGEPKSSGSQTSMPVITDCYSLLQSEITDVHKAGQLDAAWMSLPRRTPAAQPRFPFYSSDNSLMEDTTIEEKNDRSGIKPSELSDSNLNENDKVVFSKFENDSEFQALKWTIPKTMTYKFGINDHINHDKRATTNCAPIRRRRIYRCSCCSYLTCRKRFFLRHQLHLCPVRPRVRQKWRPVVSRPFDCKHCEYSASNSSNLKKHLLRHSEKKSIQCPLCSYSTDKDYFLQAHITKDHGSTSKSGKKCFMPSENFEKDGAVDNHDAQTNNSFSKANYTCVHCHYGFMKKSCLLEHQRIHTEPDNVKCPNCDYRTFRNFSNMKKHTSLSSRGSFKCNFCSYTSCTEYLITKHARLDQLKLTNKEPLETELVPVSCSSNDTDGTAIGANDIADD